MKYRISLNLDGDQLSYPWVVTEEGGTRHLFKNVNIAAPSRTELHMNKVTGRYSGWIVADGQLVKGAEKDEAIIIIGSPKL